MEVFLSATMQMLSWSSRSVRLSKLGRHGEPRSSLEGMGTVMRVGLVLGGGGVVGASWMVGALQALEDETGFRTEHATRVLGTSAGSLVASLGASGVSPDEMAAYATGDAGGDTEGAEGPYRVSLWPPPLG